MFRFRFRFWSLLFAARFFLPMFFLTVVTRLLAGWLGTSLTLTLRFVARRLDPAQGAPQIFNLPFVVKFLFFGRFNQFQNVFHLFQRFFEGFHNSAHLVRGPGQ